MDLELVAQVARDNWNDPSWYRGTVLPFAKRVAIQNALKPYYFVNGTDGIDFMDEDWDNLIILDACRYDMFEEYNTIDGRLEQRTSLSSSTPEFVTKTFGDETFHDTVYVTANPQLTLRVDEDVFFKVDRVWEDYWDEDLATVRPDTMVERTLKAYEDYPNKRIISHFMQPHYPFIGDYGRAKLGDHSGFELTRRLAAGEEATRDADSVWDRLERGELPREVVWKAYVENLQLAIEEVEPLVEEFDERTVITSDHGNLIGEKVKPLGIRMYGHPTGVHAPNLVTIPWLIREGERRKQVTTDEPKITEDEYDQEELNDRLADLGYA